jgi:hypothetical protein
VEELSIFIYESGDFGKYDENCPYYIISFVFHEQKNPITTHVKKLDFFPDIFEFRGVLSRDYKLFQTADLICSLSLINHKLNCNKQLINSEEIFFCSAGKLKKNYLKHLKRLEF